MSRYSNSQKNDAIYLNLVLSFDLHSALAPIITRIEDCHLCIALDSKDWN